MIIHASSEDEYNEMCEAEAAHDADMAAQDDHAQYDEQNMDAALEQLHRLRKLNARRNEMTADIDEDINALTSDVKRYVLDSKNTIEIKGAWVKYRKAGERTSWDSKQLAKIARSNAEVAACRKVTETAANAAMKLDV